MPSLLRSALLVGLAIAAVDWAAGSLSRLSPDGGLGDAAIVLDLLLNVILFAVGGYLGFRERGEVTGGAEVGVLAGGLAGLAAVLQSALATLPGAPPPESMQVVQTLALNIALGGLTGLAGAAVARSLTPRT